jgi:hypothetical protein
MVVMLTTPGGLGGLLTDRLKTAEHLENTLRMRKRLLVGLAFVGVVAVFLESVIRLRQSGAPQISLNGILGMWLPLLALTVSIAAYLFHRRIRLRTGASGKGGSPVSEPICQKTSDAG